MDQNKNHIKLQEKELKAESLERLNIKIENNENKNSKKSSREISQPLKEIKNGNLEVNFVLILNQYRWKIG